MNGARPNVIARICPCADKSCISVEDGTTISVPQHKVTVPLTAVFDQASQEQMFAAVCGTIDAALKGLNATILTCGGLSMLRLDVALHTEGLSTHTAQFMNVDTARLALGKPTRYWGLPMDLVWCPERLSSFMKLSKRTAPCECQFPWCGPPRQPVLAQWTLSTLESCFHYGKPTQVEIYCEKLKDLLNPACEDLGITRDNIHGCHVSGARSEPASNSEEMMSLLQQGLDNRVCVIATVLQELPGTYMQQLGLEICLLSTL
jgi:hypothetical protein